MSLEQALSECTLAIKQLIVVMTTANESGQPAADAATTKGTRGKKKEDAAATGGEQVHVLLVEGDPQGTRYFHIPAHNSIYRQLPGEPDCTLPSATIIAGSEYLRLKAEYAAKFPTGAQGAQAASPAPSPASATPAASPASSPQPDASAAPTMQTITAKLMAIHKRDGNAGVAPILAKFAVAAVPQLATKDLVEVDAHVESVLNPTSNLFG